ncbi:MAG: VWA domain-containing protein [Lachnospiraceae bacterium]|nr:VWA domain-containing protein [Lachnospiraceae bacterium]
MKFFYKVTSVILSVFIVFNSCYVRVSAEKEDISYTYSIKSDWGEGYQAEILVTNNTENLIEEWSILFKTDDEIVSIWNATIVEKLEEGYRIVGESWNRAMEPESTIIVGYIARKNVDKSDESPNENEINIDNDIEENNSEEKENSIKEEEKETEEDTDNNELEKQIELPLSDQSFPYVIYTTSSKSDSISFNASNVCINGNIITNGNVYGNSLNLNGNKEENANIEMVFLFDKIDNLFGESNNMFFSADEYSIERERLTISNPILSDAEIEIYGDEIEINNSIFAKSNLLIEGNVKNSRNVVLTSKYGNIIIEGNDSSLQGLIYAPFGDVIIKSNNLNMNGLIIISESVYIESESINLNQSNEVAKFIGIESGKIDIPDTDWKYLPDTNSNGLPDFIEEIHNWEFLVDSDEDGLPNSVELYYGTDINNKDTDSDGIDDKYELFFLFTNPVLEDSDRNGISDGMEDYDKDGLNNKEEYEMTTNPFMVDTDKDSLSDRDEMIVYCTNPCCEDTDGEGLDDGDEIKLGFNPNMQDTNSNGITDDKELVMQEFLYATQDDVIEEISISFYCSGNIDKKIIVDKISGNSICNDVVGLVGDPYEFSSSIDFSTAKVKFKLNEDVIEEDGLDELVFLWYDEENYEFVEFPTVYDYNENSVCFETSHFSKYMLVNSKAWYSAWEEEIYGSEETKSKKNFDTVLAIDCSESMSRSDAFSYNGSKKTCARIEAMEEFIAEIKSGDQLSIVTFDTFARAICELTDNKDVLLNKCKNVYNAGGTNFTDAISKSIDVLNKSNNLDNAKRIVLLSDGESSISEDILIKAKQYGIVIHTIGLGGCNETKLQYISDKTGGNYYKAKNAKELLEIYEKIGIDQFDDTDSDGDGLFDVIETIGVRIQNGQVIRGLNPEMSDSDEDALSDGQEILPQIKYKQLYGAPEGSDKAFYFVMVSNPTTLDSDNDGVEDKYDPLKLKKGISSFLKKTQKELLIQDINQQINDDLGKIKTVKGAVIGRYTTEESIDLLYEYDNLITELSNEYLIPKEMIQSILIREMRCEDLRDDVADSLVMQQFAYYEELDRRKEFNSVQDDIIPYPKAPIGGRDDSSVGVAQIFAQTAIESWNWCVINGVVEGDMLDYSDWRQRREVWKRLKNDEEYSIMFVAYVLMQEAGNAGLDRSYYAYSDEQKQLVLSLYNGTNHDATVYGSQAYNCYKIFERYNYR